MTHDDDRGQSDSERIEALEEGQALILAELAELTEKLRQATQVEEIIRRARQGNLLAMASHSRGHEFHVSTVKPGAAVRGAKHRHRKTP